MGRGIAAGLGILLLVTVIVTAAGAAAASHSGAPATGAWGGGSAVSAAAAADIPAPQLALYRAAAATCPGLDWSVLAGIGKVESDHGRAPLPGVHAGANAAGARGPMQFLPATFAAVTAAHPPPPGGAHPPSPYNASDAIYTAAAYLCDNGARHTTDLPRAVFTYNHSRAYVRAVLTHAARYRATAPDNRRLRLGGCRTRRQRRGGPRGATPRRGGRAGLRPGPARPALPVGRGRARRRRHRIRLLRAHHRRLHRRRDHPAPHRAHPIPRRAAAAGRHAAAGRGPPVLRHTGAGAPRRHRHRRGHLDDPRTAAGHHHPHPRRP